jgi:hypothetical protein
MEVSGQHHAPEVLILGMQFLVPILYEAVWAFEPAWTLYRKVLPLPGLEF